MSAAPAFAFVEGASGDLAFVARGESCTDALMGASEALLAATVEDPASVRSALVRVVELVEPDLDLLLLRFLNELVFLRDARGLLLRAREVRLEETPEGQRLRADLVGEPWCPSRHVPAADVKAATAHGLALRAVDGAWEARATLDV